MVRRPDSSPRALSYDFPLSSVGQTNSSGESSRTRLSLTGALVVLLVGASLVLLGVVRAQNAPSEAEGESARPPVSHENAPSPPPEFGPNAYIDLDKPHLLAGSYYSVRGGLTATLMLNNKGPRPLEVRPTLFSLAGERLDVLPVTVEANNFRVIDLREWVAFGGPSFEEGSIQLFHTGRDLVLGAQIYLVDEAHRLSFEEKLTEITGGGPARLEGVWWSPHAGADVRLALSNTSDTPLTVTARFLGAGRGGTNAATLDLGPHETRVVDMSRTFQPVDAEEVGARSGGSRRAGIGAVSVEHSGAGGPLLARAMVQDAESGYSSTIQFAAPEKGKSSRFEGAGLRLRGAAGGPLTAVIVARNVGDRTTTLRGRVPYTTATGDVNFLRTPPLHLGPGEAKILDLDRAVEREGIASGVSVGGLEFEYAGAPGSVVMAAHSMSADGDEVYRVPLWDPLAQRSPTGGYPWYIEGSSSTTVYIKNITRREQKYSAHILFPGGSYTFGLKGVKGGETVEINLRALRDNQVPDEEGRTLPPELSRGQIKWSLKQTERPKANDPYETLALIGRSEQTDAARGVSSNYSCQHCCTEGFVEGYISPSGVALEYGQQVQLRAYDVSQDCYGGLVTTQAGASWSSSNTSAATVSGGLVTAVGAGEVTISARWNVTQYYDDPSCGGGGIFRTTPDGEDGRGAVASSDDEEGDGGVIIMAPPRCEYGCGSLWYRTTAGAGVQTRPRVTVTAATICDDRIDIRLEPTASSGQLKVFLDGPNGAVELAQRPQQGGDTREYFYTVNLPNQEFTRIRATWNVNNVLGTGTRDYHMVVLGDYRQTCYNTPLETDYGGGVANAGTARIENNSCIWSSLHFRTAFLDEVNENGSGVDSVGTAMQIEGFCGNAPATSPAYDGRRYRRPTDIRTSCNTSLTVDQTVARGPGSSLTCGTPVFIAGIGCRVVEDRGGGLANDQLDNYKGVGVGVCQGWANPRVKTVKLF